MWVGEVKSGFLIIFTIMKIAMGVDSEDVEDLLIKVQRSYGIRFAKDDFKDAGTLGDITGIILNRVSGTPASDCTSQQGFYKLRDAIGKVTGLDKVSIKPTSSLGDIFPRANRRKKIKRVVEILDFQPKILQPHPAISSVLAILLLFSLAWYFVDGLQATIGLFSSIVMLLISHRTGKEFTVKTVGELAEKLSIENYIHIRTDPATVNKDEIRRNLIKMYSKDLGLRPHEISPGTPIL